MDAIRGAAYLVYLFAMSTVYGLVFAPALLSKRGTEARLYARRRAQRWCHLALAGLRAICGVDYRLEGRENLPAEGAPAIIAANHQSMWETLALYALLPNPVIIMKRELLRIPIFGFWLTRVGNIAVDRNAGASALRNLIKDATRALEDGTQIIIFPEGTRVAPGAVKRNQPGVAGLYVGARAPCVIALHDSGKHWRTPGPAKTPGVITLKILPPIPPGLDRKAFARALQANMLDNRPDLPGNATSAKSASTSDPDLHRVEAGVL